MHPPKEGGAGENMFWGLISCYFAIAISQEPLEV